MAKILISILIFTAPATWAFKDFKQACGIPRATPIAQRNYAENLILINSLDGQKKCWIAEFTLKDGAINEVICRRLATCPPH